MNELDINRNKSEKFVYDTFKNIDISIYKKFVDILDKCKNIKEIIKYKNKNLKIFDELLEPLISSKNIEDNHPKSVVRCLSFVYLMVYIVEKFYNNNADDKTMQEIAETYYCELHPDYKRLEIYSHDAYYKSDFVRDSFYLMKLAKEYVKQLK